MRLNMRLSAPLSRCLLRTMWASMLVGGMGFITGCPDPGAELDLTIAGPIEAYVGDTTTTNIVLTNTSDDKLTVASVTFQGGDSNNGPQIAIDGPTRDIQLAAGESQNLPLSFTALVVGSQEITIFADVVAGETVPPATITANGRNNPPVLTVSNWPTTFCQAVPVTLNAQITDVEAGDDLSELSYILSASADGRLASSSVPPSGAFARQISLNTPGAQTITLQITDANGGVDSYAHAVSVSATDADGDGVPDCTDQDGDGFAVSEGDCDDHNPTINPDASDICSGIDENCDGEVDPMPASDGDSDGTSDCVDDDQDGFTENEGDCNDGDATLNPDALEPCDGIDNNCDGFVDEGFDTDSDGFTTCNDDCDDTNPAIYPGATESCNQVDDNCDGLIDEDLDADGDGMLPCLGDCDDADASIYQGAIEVCDGVDQSCDGVVDEGFDLDSDGVTTCAGDCNDADDSIYVGATEICDGIDQNCDGVVDDGFDLDADNQTTCAGDCDDADPNAYTGALEVCDDIDQDCDQVVDEGFDVDGDGYTSCGGQSIPADCDDNNIEISPDAVETCNLIDDNCDGNIDEGFDVDRDGYTSCGDDCDDANGAINPSEVEICDGVDNDCDGVSDDTDVDGDGYVAVACAPNADPDCNDHNAEVNPGSQETCNLLDDDCDGQVDEDFDADGDGYATCVGDCDDSNPDLYPLVNSSGWIEYPCNPVITANDAPPGDALADQASVLIDSSAPEEERYKAWFRYGGSDGSRTIAYATSPDGIDWTDQGTVVSNGEAGKFDERYLNYPTVLKVGGVFHMWYHGTNVAGAQQIGYATSEDGVQWTKMNDGDPVLPPTSDGESFDSAKVESPSVVWIEDGQGGGLYYMWYSGGDDLGTFRIGVATSEDGTTWVRHGAVIENGLPGEWDGTGIKFVRVLHNGSYFIMFYSAAGDTSLTTAFGYASSDDGFLWQKKQDPIKTNGDEAGGDSSWRSALIFSPMTIVTYDELDREVYSTWFGGCPATDSGAYTTPCQTGYATNIQPAVITEAPASGSSFTTDDTVHFRIYVEDPLVFVYEGTDGTLLTDLEYVITSDLDGVLSSGNVPADGYLDFSLGMSFGTHTIEVEVSDASGIQSFEYITLYVD